MKRKATSGMRLYHYLWQQHVLIPLLVKQGRPNVKLIFVFLVSVISSSGCASLTVDSTHQENAAFSSKSSHGTVYQSIAQADTAYYAQDWLKASRKYQEVVKVIPNDAYAWFRMGNSLTQLGEYAQAVDAYETSLALDNAQFNAWFNLSTTHLLSAKVVTLNAFKSIGMNDPSIDKIERRLQILTALLQ